MLESTKFGAMLIFGAFAFAAVLAACPTPEPSDGGTDGAEGETGGKTTCADQLAKAKADLDECRGTTSAPK